MIVHHSKPYFDDQDESNIIQILRSNFVTYGSKAKEFSRLLADLTGKKWGIPTQSGTDALTMALYLSGVRKGEYVGIPSYMCSAPLDALSILGVLPLPLDIDRKTLSVNPENLSEQNEKFNIVIIPHLFGIPARIDEIHNLQIIEDCAQTLGINVNDAKIGSIGKFTVCSFYGTKLLTTGHGGMILGNENSDKEKAMKLLMHDNQEKWQMHFHYLMSDFNASLGISQVKKLSYFIEDRKKIAQEFTFALTGKTILPYSAFSRFLIYVPNADEAIMFFQDNGVEGKRPVYKPISMLLNLDGKKFPETVWAYNHIVSIPIYPGMLKEHVDLISKLLKEKRHEYRCWPLTIEK